MSELASERLNFLSKKQRAVSSRASRQVIPCSNGQTFNLSQTCRLDISGNQHATFWDPQNSYLKFTVTNNDTAVIRLESAYSLIDRIELLADGTTISDIQHYNCLVHSYLDSEVGTNFKDHFGRSLFGTSFNADELETIAAGASSTYCLPLPFLPVFSASKYIPLTGRSTLSYRITFASAATGLVGAATNTEIVISPVEMICSYIRLNEQANAMVIEHTNGIFDIIASDVRAAEGNVSTGDTVLALNAGFSFSSLDRVSWGIYPTLNTALGLSVSNRAAATLQAFALSINGEEFPRTRIRVSQSNVSETVAEIAVASRSLGDFNHQSSLQRYEITPTASTTPCVFTDKFYLANPSGLPSTDAFDYETNRGTYMAMIDTESMKPHADSEALFSGISTLGSVVQLVGTFSSVPANATVIAFAQYTLSMRLDLNGSQTWVVSI